MTVGSVAGGQLRVPADDPPRFSLLGTEVALIADRPDVLDRLVHLLAPFATASEGEDRTAPSGRPPTSLRIASADRGATIVCDGRVVAEVPWTAIDAEVLAAINALALAGYDGLAVHAGVVAREDRAVCFPGVSGAGKSTLTAACLGSGFAYVSDEALCLDRSTRRVERYPRPLALSVASCALLGIDPGDPPPGDAGAGVREVILTPAELGAATVRPEDALRLTDVVELQRGSDELHLEPVHPARAVPALLSMSFNHFKEPDASVAVVGALAREVRVWRLHYDDPVAAAALLARELP